MNEAIERQEWTPTPARNYSWEPFTQGNTAAQKSGYWSDRIIGPLADDVLESLLGAIHEAGASYLLSPLFRYTLRRTAVAIARLENEEKYLSDHPADEASKSRRDKAEASVKWWLGQSGLTAASTAKVRDRAVVCGRGSSQHRHCFRPAQPRSAHDSVQVTRTARPRTIRTPKTKATSPQCPLTLST